MQFGRRPQDIAFAAGNREIFTELHNAARAAPEPADSNIPDPSDFWKYIENAAGPADPSGDVPLPPQHKAPEPKAPNPREEFESWLGGILFPQRARRAEERRGKQETGANAPYSNMRAPEMEHAPRMRPRPTKQTYGRAGGSQFAQKRAEKAAEAEAKQRAGGRTGGDDWAPETNVRTGLEPYGAQQQGRQGKAQNPLEGLLQAFGNKAQQDIRTTMEAFGGGRDTRGELPESKNLRPGAGKGAAPPGRSHVARSPPPTRSIRLRTPPRAGRPVATEGDSDFDDSDDYDLGEVDAHIEKKHAEERAEKDPWGMPGLFRKPVTDSQGRLMSVAEAREQLLRMDEATNRAQGWLRGRDAARRLEAMKTLAAAQHAREERAEARNPLQVILDALWQRPRPQQVRPCSVWLWARLCH